MPSRTTWYIMMPTFAASAFLLIVGLGGAYYMHRANREASISLDQKLAETQSAEQLVLAIRELRLNLDTFVDTGDPADLETAQSLLGTMDPESHVGQAGQAAEGDAGKSHFQEISRQLEQLRAGADVETQRAEARRLIALVNSELLRPAENVLAESELAAKDASRQNQIFARRIGLGLGLLGVCGAVAGLLAGFGVARSVHRSLVEIRVPVRDIAGQLNEVVGPITVSSNTDLSELDGSLRALADKTADLVQKLQESQRQALRHEQLAAVGQLAAGLAHELRNPLMSVKLIVQTALERDGEALNRRDLAVLQDETIRLEAMLQTFLDFARPPQPQKCAIDAGQLVAKTLDVVRLRAGQQDVALHYQPDEEPLWVEADESQMRQVLLNLLLNALDVLTEGGNIWLKVHAETPAHGRPAARDGSRPAAPPGGDNGQPAAAPQVVIRVADDGPGLAAEVAERIFDPFVSTKDTGIGLGLSICRRIVESHGGLITARNRAEGGAEFTVRVPQKSVAAEPSAGLQEAAPPRRKLAAADR